MVYCGKASLGCQNCRTRRIKCDKLRPECSQCIRVGKKCPGYRDQLSLMFRDESSKVMQKAHAQWGAEPAEASSSSAASDSSQSPTVSSSGTSLSPVSTRSQTSPPTRPRAARTQNTVPIQIDPTWTEKGVQFFIDHFVLGMPDEPLDAQSLRDEAWVYSSNIQTTMAAVGLAGLANLRNSKDLAANARKLYGAALKDTGEILGRAHQMPIDLLMRNVLMLAMFEIVNASDPKTQGAQTHIIGAAALLRSFVPMQASRVFALRGLLQLCFSLLLSCVVSGHPIPPAFMEWVGISVNDMPDEEQPSIQLVFMMMGFVTLTSSLRGRLLLDGDDAGVVLQQLLSIEDEMENWESSLQGKWEFQLHKGEFPPKACFRGMYHTYSDNWTARVWNFYRWARVLTCATLLDFFADYPLASSRLGSAALRAREGRALATSVRMAEDILISVPTHWKHPSLNAQHREFLKCVGGAGSGVVGVPGLLFHLVVAGSAHGAPREFCEWAHSILEAIWGDMGIVHARSLAERLRLRLDTPGSPRSVGLITRVKMERVKLETD